MESWDNIVDTAMIGTGKKQPDRAMLPQELLEFADTIQLNTSLDKEEHFLQLAAVTLNFRQSASVPVRQEGINLDPAPGEEKMYGTPEAIQSLKNILSEESIPLLQMWLEYGKNNAIIAPPVMIPALLSIGVQQKKLQPLIHFCCGKRGEWMSKFNPQWNFLSGDEPEQVWLTGTMEMRKSIFRETRENNPRLAVEWLQKTWKEEDANAKQAFLELLHPGISESDLPFLESLNAEKGKKVKEEVTRLQLRIPCSSIVLSCQQALEQRIHLKKEKALLGLVNKTALVFESRSLEGDLYKSGFQKLSNNKEYTDDEYILFQLVEAVPPSFWEKQLQCKPEQVIEYFQKDNTGKKLMPALVNAVVRFNNKAFAVCLMQYSEVFYIDILPLLPAQQQEFYSVKFFAAHPDSILRYALQYKKEWSYDLAKLILEYAAKSPYQYSRSFFNLHIHLIPVTILPELDKFAPPEVYHKTMWVNTCEYITRLVHLKQQILNAFKI